MRCVTSDDRRLRRWWRSDEKGYPLEATLRLCPDPWATLPWQASNGLTGRVGAFRGYAVARDESTASETDAQLVARVRSGDARAFERLVRRHLRMAHAVARSKLDGDPDDADDVCQEAFVTALQRIDDCREPDRFAAWLASIVRNKAHNYRSYLAVRRAAPLDSAHSVHSPEDTGEQVERHEFEAEIEEAVKHLTELQRAVFVRFDLEGWGHSEIAEDLGISQGASRFHLHAARRTLRKRLTAYPMAWSG